MLKLINKKIITILFSKTLLKFFGQAHLISKDYHTEFWLSMPDPTISSRALANEGYNQNSVLYSVYHIY